MKKMVAFKQTVQYRILLYLFWVALISGVLFVILNFTYIQFRVNEYFAKKNPVIVDQPSVAKEEALAAPNRVEVPSLSIDAPVIYTDEQRESAFQELLQNGVVHYPGTAKPGQAGNVYIFGHSSDFAWTPGSYKTVFAKLPEIQLGTEIRISDDAGKIYTYKVIETKVVGPKDTSVLTQDPAKKLLTLQTSYPVGTALKRFLAVSELVE